ncbi:MAG: 4Fe-4S dicluster domain-containing protein [Desulfobacteraceae bacterium]|nr:4Fe-4S dicluster domain-containing protein [Desulfobacteraceae bacterium]MBU4052931.1 4Fe-4S binding protein [Pseudomonadota bacterium]
MSLPFLKKGRVVISLVFFSGMAVLFLDLSFSIPARYSGSLTSLQLVPSLLKFISGAGFAAAGFIFILCLTLIFGRVYCSSICPLGTLQDIFAYVRKKGKKRNYAYQKAFSKTRYGILSLVILFFLGGQTLGIILLDPYSSFGRIMTQLVRPLAIAIKNTLSFSLARVGEYSVFPVEYTGLHIFSFFFTLGVLFLILWLSLNSGRLYCNTLCPVGALLGILSRYSLFKIGINNQECVDCKRCEKVCKSSCIHLESNRIDSSRCVSCFNCFEVCPTSAMEFQWGFGSNKFNPDAGKRDFIKQFAICLMTGSSALAARPPIEIYKDSTLPVPTAGPVSPPGSLSREHFMARCTACHLCVSACPTRVLQPAFLEYGWLGVMQPRMDYQKSFCNYDCVICTRVCPSGALVPKRIEEKKSIQLGKAKFIQGNCVVYTHKTDCGACAEHCPTKAVDMVLDPEVKLRAPKIDETICVGCGACEFACPTKPHKSIYVESNPVHLAAKKPKEEKLSEKVNYKSDFPF